MTKLISLARKLLSCPFAVGSLIFLMSAISLISALIGEHVFGLKPCILCIYQRVPFVVNLALGLMVIGFAINKRKIMTPLTIKISGISFLFGSIVAMYHTGVERHWWTSFLEACDVSFDNLDPATLLASIEASAPVRCDVIPWADPILGLSMANYNAMMSLGLAIICFISAALIKHKNQTIDAPSQA